MIQNNEKTKMLHMKYNINIDSYQVQGNLKTHEYTTFFRYNPLEN